MRYGKVNGTKKKGQQMAIKFNKTEEVEKPREWQEGEYLMKITRSEEKTYNSGNTGYEVDFTSNDGLNIKYQKYFAFGKASNNFLVFLQALGYCEGMTVKDMETSDAVPEADELTGLFVYVDTKKDADGKYLEPKFCGYRAYEQQAKPEPKKATSKAPF